MYIHIYIYIYSYVTSYRSIHIIIVPCCTNNIVICIWKDNTIDIECIHKTWLQGSFAIQPSRRLREQQAQDLQQRRLREDLKVALEAPRIAARKLRDVIGDILRLWEIDNQPMIAGYHGILMGY